MDIDLEEEDDSSDEEYCPDGEEEEEDTVDEVSLGFMPEVRSCSGCVSVVGGSVEHQVLR